MQQLIISLVIILGYSCSSEKPSGKTEAEILYKEAVEMVNDERYLLATERLNILKSQYPYSFYATHAELLQADILYAQESYVESAAAYLLFKEFHPKHERINYVIKRIADSYFNQLPDTFDRDLSPSTQAIKYYKEFIERFPNDEYIKEAKARIKTSYELLGKKSRYIADFYFKTEKFDAAAFRYLNIIDTHEEKDLKEYAKYRAVLSFYSDKNYLDCIKYSHQFEKELPNDLRDKLTDIKSNCNKSYEVQLKSGEKNE